MRSLFATVARNVPLLALALSLPAPLPAQARAYGAWRSLEKMRHQLTRVGPLAAEMTQHWIPSGFEQDPGEFERGRFRVALPHCLRWDYTTPFDRSYLLAGRELWSWTEATGRGDQVVLPPDQAWFAELLLAPLESLRTRLRAEVRPGKPARLRVSPRPREVDAITIEIELDGRDLPVSVSWTDAEGNRTVFRFTAWNRDPDPDLCRPPLGIDWQRSTAR